MAAYKPRWAIVALSLSALFLSAFSIMVGPEEFANARGKIIEKKPNINYTTFCSELVVTGGDKIACRIKDVPSVGFLVCKSSEVVEEGQVIPCIDIINAELGNITELSNANIKTVTVSSPAIHNVTCGEDRTSLNCTGFLEGWINATEGTFQHVRDHISKGPVNELELAVKGSTIESKLKTTAADLENIIKYMQFNHDNINYRQICDLQGFFLANGGFLVNDTPNILPLGLDESCWPGEPNTTSVLVALKSMVVAFNMTSV